LFIDEVHLLGGAKHLTDLLKPSSDYKLQPKNIDKKIYLLGLRAFYSTFLKNRFFIFTKKWHNNSEEKKAVVNCLFLFLKKGGSRCSRTIV